jgi:O-antigen/teichoic acid export membrane protein
MMKNKAVRNSLLELSSYAFSQLIRFCSSLILTRLLFPEAMGLSLLVATFVTGLVLLSDIGIDQSVIQNKSGDQSKFLNTAWTMRVIRSIGLWVLACAAAWPLSILYEEPLLVYLIPVGALSVPINSIASMSLIRLRRDLALGPLTVMEIISQLVSFITTVVWAYCYPSVWALVAGGLVGITLRTIISYFFKRDHAHRFLLDMPSMKEIFHFGKWIFGSSALHFITQHGDRLMLAKFMGAATLGIYSIALLISEVVSAAVLRITHGVLYPVFSKVRREDPAALCAIYYKARLAFDALGLISIGGLAVLSGVVVDIIYDPRYSEAGWMLQALCIRAAMSVVLVPAETCLFSLGHTRYGFYQNVAKSAWILIGIPLCWYVWGLEGLVWCVAFSQVPAGLVLFSKLYRLGMLSLLYEVRALAFFGTGLVLGYGAKEVLLFVAPMLLD